MQLLWFIPLHRVRYIQTSFDSPGAYAPGESSSNGERPDNPTSSHRNWTMNRDHVSRRRPIY